MDDAIRCAAPGCTVLFVPKRWWSKYCCKRCQNRATGARRYKTEAYRSQARERWRENYSDPEFRESELDRQREHYKKNKGSRGPGE